MEEKFAVSEDIFATVGEFQGKKRIDLRKWYSKKDGEMARGKNGLNIPEEEWDDLCARWEELVAFVNKELGRK